jgi:hypothetical protein
VRAIPPNKKHRSRVVFYSIAISASDEDVEFVAPRPGIADHSAEIFNSNHSTSGKTSTQYEKLECLPHVTDTPNIQV